MRGDEVGHFKGALGAGLMSASEVAVHLLTSCPSLEHFEAYMFGSAIEGIGADIDCSAA